MCSQVAFCDGLILHISYLVKNFSRMQRQNSSVPVKCPDVWPGQPGWAAVGNVHVDGQSLSLAPKLLLPRTHTNKKLEVAGGVRVDLGP